MDTIRLLLTDPERIAEILKCPVASGKVMAADAVTGAVPTLNGAKRVIAGDYNLVRVNDKSMAAASLRRATV